MPNFHPQPTIILSSSDVNDLMKQAYELQDFNCSIGASKETSSNVGEVKKGHYLYDEEGMETYVADEHCDFDQVVFILHALCEKGLIPEGNYVVDHSW